MPTVWIPTQLRDLTGGRERVRVSGATVGEVIDALERIHSGIKSRLCDEGGLRPDIAVAVDAQIAPLGLLEEVAEPSEVHFLPAIGGGSG